MDLNPADMLIADMEFSNRIVGARIRNVLRREGVRTLDQLLKFTEGELLDMRNFGTVCLAELTVKLKRMGLSLQPERRYW